MKSNSLHSQSNLFSLLSNQQMVEKETKSAGRQTKQLCFLSVCDEGQKKKVKNAFN